MNISGKPLFALLMFIISGSYAQVNVKWKLAWSDEFEYFGLPNASKWTFDTTGSASNLRGLLSANSYAFVGDGSLKIVASGKKTTDGILSHSWFSTAGKGEWKIGKVEVRAGMHVGSGARPVVMLIPPIHEATNPKQGPSTGYRDIHEAYLDSVWGVGKFPKSPQLYTDGGGIEPNAKQGLVFHTYSLIWSDTLFTLKVDSMEIFRRRKSEIPRSAWIFENPAHLFVGVQTEGFDVGDGVSEAGGFQPALEIDYVRVYKSMAEEEIIQRPAAWADVEGSEYTVDSVVRPKVFKSFDGLISIPSHAYSVSKGWRKGSSYTGVGMFSRKRDSSQLRYEIHVKRPGVFHLYLLGHRQRNKLPDEQNLDVNIVTPGVSQVKSAVAFKPLNATSWHGPFPLGSLGKGRHVLEILSSKASGGVYIEKILLANSATFPVSGIGPDPTDKRGGRRHETILPPSWAFGVLYGGYTNQQETLEAVNRIRAGGFPIDAYWIDSWFWDFGNFGKGPRGYIDFKGDSLHFPDLRGMWQKLKDNHVKAGVWIWDCIIREGNEEVFQAFDSMGFFKRKYINNDRWHNKNGNTLTGDIDFENGRAVDYWKSKMARFFESGLDFLKLDRSSSIPFTKAAFESTQEFGMETRGRGFVLSHLHSTYDPRHRLYPTKWTGDAKIAWSQPDYPDNGIYAMGGLRENIQMVSDPSRTTYEIPFLTHDAGGYDFFGSRDFSDELYMRWIQFACFNSIMTLFSQHTNSTRNHPYSFSEEVQANFKKYAGLRMRLFPYIYTNAHQTRLGGRKMVRGDGVNLEQYLFGDNFLVAPVFEKGVVQRTVYFPKGTWYDFESHEAFEGGASKPVDVTGMKLPLFVKAGSIIPMRPFSLSVEEGSSDTLYLHVYGGADGEFTLIEDDGSSNDYRRGMIAKTRFKLNESRGVATISLGPTEGRFKGMKDFRHVRLNYYGQEVVRLEVDGSPHPFDSANDRLSVSSWSMDMVKSNGHRVQLFLQDR